MSDAFIDRTPELSGLEVRVFRHGRLVHREVCESEEEAVLAVDAWSEFDDVECRVVEACSTPHHLLDGMEEEEPLGADADFPDEPEGDRSGSGPPRRRDGWWE